MPKNIVNSIKERMDLETGVSWEHIGTGMEGIVFSAETDTFTGLGGIIKSKPVKVARRVSNWMFQGTVSEQSQKAAYNVFFKNILASILDAHAIGSLYSVGHISVPLETFSYGDFSGYGYKYVEGNEGWPCRFYYKDFGDYCPTRFREEKEVLRLFNSYGIRVGHDSSDSHDGRTGKNIIYLSDDSEDMSVGLLGKGWRRIDFGTISLPVNLDILNSKKDLGYLGEHELLFKLSRDYLSDQKIIEPSDELVKEVFGFREYAIDRLV
tara:strand:- start:3474 stop:4271 length:798 start_codon:yes stop_codon:yes gene_type:complete